MANEYYGGGLKQEIQAVAALGTSSVTTQTKAVGATRRKLRVKSIRFYGSAAVTGTSLTAEVFARTTAGAAGNTLQASATDVAFASEAAARAGTAATLTATGANLVLDEGQLLEVTFTASSVTAGPDDVLTVVEYEVAF